jgi:hypothetical protein
MRCQLAAREKQMNLSQMLAHRHPEPVTVIQDGSTLIRPVADRRKNPDDCNLLDRIFARRESDKYAAVPVQHSALGGLQ